MGEMGKLTSTQSADTGNEVDALAAKTLGVLGDCAKGGSGRRITERGFAPANFESCQYSLLLRHVFGQGLIARGVCANRNVLRARKRSSERIATAFKRRQLARRGEQSVSDLSVLVDGWDLSDRNLPWLERGFGKTHHRSEGRSQRDSALWIRRVIWSSECQRRERLYRM